MHEIEVFPSINEWEGWVCIALDTSSNDTNRGRHSRLLTLLNGARNYYENIAVMLASAVFNKVTFAVYHK